VNLPTAPLERWLKPDKYWAKSDIRLWQRAKASGHITEQAADRLCLRYAHVQLEVVHPDYQP